MSKKHTIEFVRKQFEAEGYDLLSEKYMGAFQKLEYICSNGHNGTIKWNSWQQGHRCAECAKVKKLTIEFIRKQFEKEAYILLTTKYTRCDQKLKYLCPKNHRGTIKWNEFRQGYRCAECAGVKKLTIEFIRKEFKKENYTLFSTEYKGSKISLLCVCPNGHRMFITWDCWNRGHRCQKCYFENNRGKNNPSWNPNLTDEERKIKRNYLKYTEWRKLVYERDNFTCQVCGQVGGCVLNAHHLESYDNNPGLRTELDNGITLCVNCHKNFHRQYGRGNNTKRQFEEFISIGV